MNILAIETSCDETAAAVVKDGRKIISSSLRSQIKIHEKFMGVVPELASRAHVHMINSVLEKTMAHVRVPVHAIAVTTGPGLTGSLLVGRMVAETLGWVNNLPVLGVNHIEGHLLSALISNPRLKPPFVGLIVSGGHTEIIYVSAWGQYELVGRTRDDAAGEAFDKVSKMLKLGYPGGPLIERLAEGRNPRKISFPIPWLPQSWDFSFSGLKTAVLYKLKEKKNWKNHEIKDICAGFQNSVVRVLVEKTISAARELKCFSVVIGGGVAANSELRRSFMVRAQGSGIRVYLPNKEFCTDNAAMIGVAAYFKIKQGIKRPFPGLHVTPYLTLPKINRKMPFFQPPKNEN